ncbi:MAG: hypothetical protein ACOYNL_01635 [Rickettsiales bacterium]
MCEQRLRGQAGVLFGDSSRGTFGECFAEHEPTGFRVPAVTIRRCARNPNSTLKIGEGRHVWEIVVTPNDEVTVHGNSADRATAAPTTCLFGIQPELAAQVHDVINTVSISFAQAVAKYEANIAPVIRNNCRAALR